MNNSKIIQKTKKTEDLIDHCKLKLGVLSVAFGAMGNDEPDVDLVFFDGMKSIIDDMINQLVEAHELTDQIKSHAGEEVAHDTE